MGLLNPVGFFGGNGVVTSPTFTAKQDDYDVGGADILRWDGAGSTGITGLAAKPGRVLTIVNASTDYLLWLENENTASSAANRLMLPDSFPAFLMPGDAITLWYDTTTARWRVLSWPTRGARAGFDIFGDGLMAYNEPFRSATASGTGATLGVAAGVGVTNFGAKGLWFIRTGTTPTGYAHQHMGTNQCFMTDEGPYFSGYRVSASNAPDATDDFVIEIGISNRLTTTAFSYGAQWQLAYSGGSARWAMQAGDNSTIETTTSGAPSVETITTGYVELYIFINSDGSRADFLKCEDGVNVSLVYSSTHLIGSPSSFAWFEGITKSAGTNVRDLYIDWRGYRAGNSQVRP